MNEYKGNLKIAKYNIHNFPEGRKSWTCPLCSEHRHKKTEKCVKIFWEQGFAKCFHCGEVIQMHEWEKGNDKEKKYVIPTWQNNTELSDKVIKYFEEDRKISQFIIRLMKVSEGVEIMPDRKSKDWIKKNTIQFPYHRYGEVINVKYRSADKSFKMCKDAEKIPYNLDNIIGNETIYCVEGEIDVLSVMECGIHNVTSPPNGFTKEGVINLDWLNNDVETFTNATKLVLCFDNDIPGQNGRKEFIRRFGAHKCYCVDLKECKDANEYLQKYGKDALKLALETHIEIPLENVSTYNQYKAAVRSFFLNGMPRGIVTDTLHNLDENFSTLTSQILLVTGRPSCFDKNRLVHTSKGVCEISKLNIGDSVLSYNHTKRINEYKRVIDVSINDNHPGKMYKIKMKDGSEIKVTDNHRFFTGSEYLQIKDILISLGNKSK